RSQRRSGREWGRAHPCRQCGARFRHDRRGERRRGTAQAAVRNRTCHLLQVINLRGWFQALSYRSLPMVFGSMIFSVISRMSSGIRGIALTEATSTSEFGQDEAFHYNRLLDRGINLVTALGGPQESLGCHARGRLISLDKGGGVQFGAHSHRLVGACQRRRS